MSTYEKYFDMIRYLATLTHREEQADRLIGYIQRVITDIQHKASTAKKPRVYAVLSHPLLPLYAVKTENQLVEIAGGTSLNRELGFTESANPEYTVEELNALDPEVIIISGNFATPVIEFISTCKELGISCRALDAGRVYTLNTDLAGSSQRWALGLMDVANILHPDIFQYSLPDEDAKFNHEINFSGQL